MIIPKGDSPLSEASRLELYRHVEKTCLASREERIAHYAENRRWFLFGCGDSSRISPWNKVESHLDTVSSFLYSSDTTRFSWEPGDLAPDVDYQRTEPATRRVSREWKRSNADILCGQAVTWSLVYSSMFVKMIRRRDGTHPFLVDPGCFGVYREDIPMLDRQEAFSHVYYMTFAGLQRALRDHPKRDEILKTIDVVRQKDDIQSQIPAIVDRILLQATNPSVIGQANISADALADYTPRTDVELVQLTENWIWNDAIDDFQTVTMGCGEVVIYDRPNIFMPRTKEWDADQPFVQFCPNPMYDYFWGKAELDKLAPLQDKRNERMDQIDRLLDKAVDPPNAWAGQGITDEKIAAFNQPGSNVAISDPSLRRETFAPVIPNNLYIAIDQIDREFEEVSGITNVLAGRGEAGVRSAGHASKLANLASSRPKKRALIVQYSLEAVATRMARCLYTDDPHEMFDEQNHKFILAQMSPDFEVKVDGHSNSPVFAEGLKEEAILLRKEKAITRKRLIQLFNPPMQQNLIRDLEEKIIPAEKAAAQQKAQLEQEAINAKGEKGLSLVKK